MAITKTEGSIPNEDWDYSLNQPRIKEKAPDMEAPGITVNCLKHLANKLETDIYEHVSLLVEQFKKNTGGLSPYSINIELINIQKIGEKYRQTIVSKVSTDIDFR